VQSAITEEREKNPSHGDDGDDGGLYGDTLDWPAPVSVPTVPVSLPRSAPFEQKVHPRAHTPPSDVPANKKQSGSHARRRKSRDAKTLLLGQRPSAKTSMKVVRPSIPLETDLTTKSLPVSQGAYGATHEQPVDASIPYTINELVQLGFTVVGWDGM
jgi:hypothetical protein